MRNRLERITLKGFKTIKALENFEPGPLTVLIGPNGGGKSNFISFFHMMSWALADPDNLPLYVGQQGGASKLLHDGPDRKRMRFKAELAIQSDDGHNEYAFRLVFAAGDTLIFADERYRWSATDLSLRLGIGRKRAPGTVPRKSSALLRLISPFASFGPSCRGSSYINSTTLRRPPASVASGRWTTTDSSRKTRRILRRFCFGWGRPTTDAISGL